MPLLLFYSVIKFKNMNFNTVKKLSSHSMIYFWILSGIIGLYFLVSWFVYLFQRKFLFHPLVLDQDYRFESDHFFDEIWINGSGKSKLNALHFKLPNPKGCVLYHHGNSRNLVYWSQYADDLLRQGFDVLVYDYRTFGKSTGRLTERSLYKDAQRFHQYLIPIYGNQKIVQYGRSLGSAMATRIAKKYKSPLLILETPYVSMKEMARRTVPFLPINLILKFQLRLDLDIKKVKCPIHIFSGTDDELTPHSHSLELMHMNDSTTMTIIQGGTHNDLSQFNEYQKGLDDCFEKYF